VIPSRKRVQACTHALKLFPQATVCVDEAEAADYAPLCAAAGVELLLHPSEVAGIGPLRQWILDNVADETVFMVDDDVGFLGVVAGRGTRRAQLREPDAIAQVVANAAHCAQVLGTPVFGFSQNGADVRKFRPQDPFVLATWVGGGIGIIGRELRYDTELRLRADIDFCLQALLKYRCVYMDNRFALVHQRFNNTGGNAHQRSGERNAHELAYLRQKWGKWLQIRQAKSTTLLSITNVTRRQTIRLQD